MKNAKAQTPVSIVSWDLDIAGSRCGAARKMNGGKKVRKSSGEFRMLGAT